LLDISLATGTPAKKRALEDEDTIVYLREPQYYHYHHCASSLHTTSALSAHHDMLHHKGPTQQRTIYTARLSMPRQVVPFDLEKPAQVLQCLLAIS
jgi:hypothetical protein